MGNNLSIPVIIIDDEELIRSLIINSVEWERLGFSIVAEADNSDDALRLVREKRPRLAVIDINIPYISGIELAKLLRQGDPDLAIIILTGYEEFSYAQQAIRIGVSNYLLKPLKPEELRQSLEDIQRQVMTREQGDFVERLSRQLDLEGDLRTREEFLRILLVQSNVIPLESLQKGAALFKLDLVDPRVSFFQLFVVAAKNMTNKAQVLAGTRIEPLEARMPVSLQWTVDYHGSPALIAFWRTSDRKTCLTLSEQVAISLRHQIAIKEKLPCSVGVGTIEREASAIFLSYNHALDALAWRFHTDQDRVFTYQGEHTYTTQPHEELLSLFDPKRLLVMMRGGAENELLESIRRAVALMQGQHLQREQCVVQIMRYVNTLESFLQEQHLGMNQVFGESFDLFKNLQGFDSLPALRDWLEWLTAQTFLTVVDNGKSRTHFVVMRAKRFIEQHFGRTDMNLELIADHVMVSPSYLSGTFKKILGVSIVSYLTEFRLSRAKHLMDTDPMLTVAEVAEAVGYSDAFYFSKVFAKQEGLNPSHYMKRKSGVVPIQRNSQNP